MKILYISGAMKDSDFNRYVKNAKFSVNPSNQNFHYRFIKALGLVAPLTALTLRPFAKGLFDVEELKSETSNDGNITFNYLPDKVGRFYKLFKKERALVNLIVKGIEKSKEDTVLLVDAMKYALAKAAIKAGKKKNVKVFAIVTDNPKLLSNESKFYSKAIMSLYKKYNGYISLSQGLNELANKLKKPSYIFNGFAESLPKVEVKETKPYFFCCGALYERYGIMNMIEAFTKVTADIEFLIAGHGPLIDVIKKVSKVDSRIRYIGLLSKDLIHAYEQNSVLNINPRLYDTELDKYSVPSKVLEYLASGTPLLSTMHTSLHDEFCGEAIWIKDGSVEELRKAMELFLNIQNGDMKKKALLAQEKAIANYGLKVQGLKIYEFLAANSSFSNN